MKRLQTKTDIRNEIEQQIQDFLRTGGEVEEVERGISGREDPTQAVTTIVFDKTQQTRTPIPEVLEALNQRRQKNKPTPAPKKPKRKVIYDDFGEPLRWEWED